MQSKTNKNYPLVSIVCYCKDRVATIARCINSILRQDYPNIEIVVQDGASTDGTLEILRGYGDKIKLVSEKDFGPDDAMFRGLCRAKGEFFCFCLSDEELLPHMVFWAAANIQKYPEAAAVYGDVYLTDIDGNITGVVYPNKWDFEPYFCSESTPPFVGSLFRTACYRAIGFTEYRYDDEFALWINLAGRFPIHYVPSGDPIAKFAVHPDSSAHQKQTQIKRFASRRRAIEEFCDNPQMPKSTRLLRKKALNSLVVWNAMNHCKIGSWDMAKKHIPDAFEAGPNPKKLLHLAKLIYAHIVELRQKGDLQEALEFLDILEKCKVTGKELDCQKEQILDQLAKTKPTIINAQQNEIILNKINRLNSDPLSEIYETTKTSEPEFSFVMIVLNGMPFIEYSLKSVYDFAHEIIIVEGAVKDCMFAANPDGSSKDGTVEFIKSFPDPDNKIKLIQGRWPEKCEMQNEALKHVTGNYVWLIDSDEVYKKEHLEKIKEILKNDPSITQVNFIPDSFWKGLDYIFVSSKFFEYPTHYRRLFKYVHGAVFTTHRPPTMVWPGSGKTTEQMSLLDGSKTRQMGIIFYHYSYVLDEQVRQKIELYYRYGWSKGWNIDLAEWYNQCFLRWQPWNREEIDSKYPIWTGDKNSHTMPFSGTHPGIMMEYIHKDAISSGSSSAMQHVIGAINEIKNTFANQQINAIETGTIRSYYEKHFSTYHIARTLDDRGNLTSVDISADSIRISEQICHTLTNIRYVKSDSIEYLKKLKDVKFHFAFLDSVNDKEFIFEEFKLIIPMMIEGSVLMVDDAGITADSYEIDGSVSAQKGHKVLRFLSACGIQPQVLQTTQGHGTQLKIVMSRENLTKIKKHFNIVGYPQSRSLPFSKSVTDAENISNSDNSINNILWVRTDSIGDNVLASSMLPHIRAKYKNAKITVLCQEHIAELYESCPFADDTIVFNKRRAIENVQYRRVIIKQLEILNPDVCLNSVYSREPLTDIFAISCGAKQCIALDGDLCNTTAEFKHKCDRFYTTLISSDGEYKSELQRHRDFLKALGIEVQALQPVVWVTQQAKDFADRLFHENNLDLNRTIVLFAGAQHSCRLYEGYGRALSEVCKKNELTIIALGTKEDRQINQRNLDQIGIKTINLSGKTSILESAAILKRCRLAVGAETGLAHISCAVRTPNVILLGGGHFGRFMPYSPLTSTACMPLDCYGCNWGTCNCQGRHCVKDVAPEVIVEAFRQTFTKSSEKHRIFAQNDSIREPGLSQHSRKILDRFLDMDKVEFIPVKSSPSEVYNNLLADGLDVRLHQKRTKEHLEFTIATSIMPKGLEKQKWAIASWLKLGFNVVSLNCAEEINILQKSFPDVEFIQTKRDGREQFDKPVIYFDDFIEYFEKSGTETCGIVNSDIFLIADEDIISFIKNQTKKSLVYGSRMDIGSLEDLDGDIYEAGFDFFFFHKSLLSCFPKSHMCLGLPWWDYWMPLVSALGETKLKKLVSPFAYHLVHSMKWNEKQFGFLMNECFEYLVKNIKQNVHANTNNTWSLLQKILSANANQGAVQDGVKLRLSASSFCNAILKFLENETSPITYASCPPVSCQRTPVCTKTEKDTYIHEYGLELPKSTVLRAEYDVSIVLCTKDRAQSLDRMLDSLKKATRRIVCEIIVVEGGSSDNTLEVLRKHNIKKVYNESEHLGPGRHSWPQLYNFGLSKASGKWAMYASDDIIFAKNCITNASESLNRQKDRIAGGIFFYKNVQSRPDWDKYGIDFTPDSKLLMNYGLVRLDYFRQVQGLHEGYRFYCADTDLCYKLYEKGWQLIPLPGCFVLHNNVLDVQKKANMSASGNDIELCRQRWKNFASKEMSVPRRLLWQEDFYEAFGVSGELAEIHSGMENFWHGLAYFQKGLFEMAELQFIKAVESRCDHWQVLWYLAKAADKCRDNDLALKAAKRVASLMPQFGQAGDLLKQLDCRTKQPSGLSEHPSAFEQLPASGQFQG